MTPSTRRSLGDDDPRDPQRARSGHPPDAPCLARRLIIGDLTTPRGLIRLGVTLAILLPLGWLSAVYSEHEGQEISVVRSHIGRSAIAAACVPWIPAIEATVIDAGGRADPRAIDACRPAP